MATTLTAEKKAYKPKSWETPACPFCASNDSRVFERFGNELQYTYQICRNCELIYQKPRPSYDSMFTETAYEVYSSNTDGHWVNGKLTPKGEIVHKEYSHIITEIQKHVGKKGRLLEIGCNTGLFLKAAKDSGWVALGVEISKTMAEIAQCEFQVETFAGDWMQIDFPQKFDAIYASHVIEHVPDPTSWMRKFREVLNPGGVVCLSVPNMMSFDRKFKRVLLRMGLRKPKWDSWRTPDHLYEPSEKSMRTFCKRMGFEIIETYTYPSEWLGDKPLFHRIYNEWLRGAAKQRYYLKAL